MTNATAPEFTRPTHEPDLEVELSLFPTDQGGRKYPLWQGCRIPHDFGLPDEMNDGMYEFVNAPRTASGRELTSPSHRKPTSTRFLHRRNRTRNRLRARDLCDPEIVCDLQVQP